MARSAITFQMTGLESVLKRIEKYDKALSTGIDKVLDDGIENIANNARNFAPQGKTGHLRASISADKSIKFSKVVTVGASYGAYVEFGTGVHVFEAGNGFVFDNAMKEFARHFFVNGQGTMYAHPFLFPAYAQEKPKIIAKIKEVLFGK